MVNVTCCGNQDRNTTTSSSFPNRPPNRTRNCYTEGQFNYMNCDGPNSACTGAGIPSTNNPCGSCKESSQGGYCKINNQFYSSHGGSPKFHRVQGEDLADLTSPSHSHRSEVNRALSDYDRRITNRIRELQLLGKDPLPKRQITQQEEPTPPPPTPSPPKEETSNTLFYIGLFTSLTVLFGSVFYILVQKNIIKLNFKTKK